MERELKKPRQEMEEGLRKEVEEEQMLLVSDHDC